MNEALFSKKLVSGGKTYFFDIRETKSGDKYLQITESRIKEGGEVLRNSISIFSDHISEYKKGNTV